MRQPAQQSQPEFAACRNVAGLMPHPERACEPLLGSDDRRAHQVGRSERITYQSDDKQITIIAKPWSQIIGDCRARLNFYQEKLRYAADLDSAKAYLQKAHAKYLPDVLSKTEKKS